MTFRAFYLRSEAGMAPENFVSAINNLFTAHDPLSLVDMDMQASLEAQQASRIDVMLLLRTGGLASYQADVVRSDRSAGTTLDDRIRTLYPAGGNLFPRFFFDLTPRTIGQRTGDEEEVGIAISEVAASSTDYAPGDQEFFTRRGHIIQAAEAISAGASGDVDLLSGDGTRTARVTGHNQGPIDLPSGARAIAIMDHLAQQVWVYPSCCDAP